MPLTPREQFKLGFLARCADEGLSPEETLARIQTAQATLEKQATGPLTDALTAGKNLAWTAGVTLPLLGLLTSGTVGAVGGLSAAKMTEGDVDPEEYKRRELIQAYRFFADRARAQQAARRALPRRG